MFDIIGIALNYPAFHCRLNLMPLKLTAKTDYALLRS